MGAMTARSREWFLRLTVVFGSLLFSLVFLEIVVRIIEPKETMRYFFVQPDSTLHHKFIPGAMGHYKSLEFNTAYAINSLGLRDDEFSVAKPPSTCRILMVGDSFTEGDGVEANETFSKRLELHLREKFPNPRYQVINAGCGSYSPLLEYLYLKTAGLRLEPDLVVLFFDLSDVFDDIQYTQLARLDSNGIPVGVTPTPESEGNGWLGRGLVSVKNFFKHNTRLYNFVRLRIERYIEGARHEGIALGDIRFDKYAMLRDNYEPVDDRDWDLSYRYILLIRDMLKAKGIDFWVVVYPYGQQVSPTEFVQGRQFWGFKTDTVYSTKPQRFMQDFCSRNGIPAINMCEDFRNLSTTVSPLFFDFNGHWRPRAHEFVAEVLDRDLSAFLQKKMAATQ